MRYSILSLILLHGCTSELPPLTPEYVVDQKVSGEQWLEYDLSMRQAAALELREWLVAEVERDPGIDTATDSLIQMFEILDQTKKSYECVDQSDEACDRVTDLSDGISRICLMLGVDDCTAGGIDAFRERRWQEKLSVYRCALQVETLDRIARSHAESPVVLKSLGNCSWQVAQSSP